MKKSLETMDKATELIARKAKMAKTIFAGTVMSCACTINAYALDIDTDYSISSDIGDTNVEGLIIGLAVWLCRLVGIGMLIWGIYGYVTARKDGEAESMNGSLGKLISGLVLICMPSILSALGIIG